MKKPLVRTTVTVLHQADRIIFEDKVNDGTVTRDGTNAKYQILHGDTVAGYDSNDEYYEIPFHAVVMAYIQTNSSTDIPEPEDEFCKTESADGESDGGSDGGSDNTHESN